MLIDDPKKQTARPLRGWRRVRFGVMLAVPIDGEKSGRIIGPSLAESKPDRTGRVEIMRRDTGSALAKNVSVGSGRGTGQGKGRASRSVSRGFQTKKTRGGGPAVYP